MIRLRYVLVLMVSLLVLAETSAYAQFYNGLNQPFGKNRLQHRDFNWRYYEFERYEIYFYSGGENVAEYTARTALPKLKHIEGMLGMQVNEKIRFVIYNKLSEYRQSNIGLNDSEDKTGGVTQISGTKAFIYFDGDYKKLSDQINRSIAEIAVNRLIYGSNWKEVVKNSTLLSVPDWYIDGLVSYLSDPWNMEIENRVKDGYLTGAYKKINHLPKEDGTLAGHAIWNYVMQTYGTEVLPNILYMTRISRSIESGYFFVVGTSLRSLFKEVERYYVERYAKDDQSKKLPNENDEVDLNTRRNRDYYNLTPNPVNERLAYVSNKDGKYRVIIFDPESGKKKTMLKGGVKLERIQDLDYPILAWHPLGERLTVLHEEEGVTMITNIDLEMQESVTRELFKLDRVNSMSYAPNGKTILMSAFKEGQTDLFEYTVVNGNLNQLTNDLNDDLHPSYVDKDHMLFTSNRDNDTLNVTLDEPFDLPSSWDVFIMTRGNNALRRVTNTPDQSETHTGVIKPKTYTYLANKNGVYNRFVAQIDSTISGIDTVVHYRYFSKSYPATNYKRSILEQVVYPANSEFSEVLFYDRKYRFYNGQYETIPNAEESFENGSYQEIQVSNANNSSFGGNVSSRSIAFESIEDTTKIPLEINVEDYVFLDEELPSDSLDLGGENLANQKAEVKEAEQDSAADEVFKLPQIRPYKINFQATDIVSAIDFDFANQMYQPFNGGPYRIPGMGTVFKIGAYDLFDDYYLEGGFRYSLNRGSNELFLSLEDRSKRWDKKYSIQRQQFDETDDFSFFNKVVVNNFKAKFSYPFSEVLSFSATGNFRLDKSVVGAVDAISIEEPNGYTPHGGAKMELIFDNTSQLSLNLRKGTRLKVWYERYQKLNDLNTDLNVWGVDFRHYQPIHRNVILAFRLAGSNSFGQEKLVYYMGDVDNSIVLGDRRRFNDSIKISNTQNYRWQTIATNMRGFRQNIRNGNSFVVANTELRFPVVTYFSTKPVKSDLAANLQLIGFVDVGTAWTGPSPFSEENEFNFEPITTGPITVVLKNTINPIVGSFGGGIRSMLFGYFVRLDYAYGVNDGLIRKPIFHLSISTDF